MCWRWVVCVRCAEEGALVVVGSGGGGVEETLAAGITGSTLEHQRTLRWRSGQDLTCLWLTAASERRRLRGQQRAAATTRNR